MKVLTVAPKDIYVTIEIGLKNLKQIITALDHAKIEYDSKANPDAALAVIYLTKEFYPGIKEVVTDLEKEFVNES